EYLSVALAGIAPDTGGTLPLPSAVAGPVLFAVLGSAIGGFHSAAAAKLLRRVRRTAGPSDRLLLGVDLRKEHQRLVAAYNDPGGVMAALNRNILAVVNARLGSDFEPQRFE